MAERSILLAEAPVEVRALADPAAVMPDARVFIGPLLRFVQALGYPSNASYQTIKSNLVTMGCLARLRRGTGRVDAVWLLVAEPTIERWGRHIERPGNVRRLLQVKAEHHARLAMFLRDLPSIAPTLAEELRLAGCRTVADVLTYLRALPTMRLVGLGPGACLRFCGRTEHTCGAEQAGPQPVQPHPEARLVK